MQTLRIGQFSTSPVLVAARHHGWDAAAGLDLQVEVVTSSPAQFGALRDRTIDVAVTSPDNVMLYATTARNPMQAQVPLRMHRLVDGGLGLALVTRPEITTVGDLRGRRVGVDVLPSGFAMLLKGLLRDRGIDPDDVTFVEEGGTPRRATRLIEGAIEATILNAESRIRAEAAGMVVHATSVEISDAYPGTVLATLSDGPDLGPLLEVWSQASDWLLRAEPGDVRTVLGQASAELGTEQYLELLRDPVTGVRLHPAIHLEALQVLARLRQQAGAYTPTDDDLRALATG